MSSISKTPQKILPLYKRAQTKRALLNDVVHLSVLFPPPTQNLHKSKTLAECRDRENESEEEEKMSSTLLEVTRAAHEEVERLERLIVKDLQTEPATAKDRLYQSHRARSMIDQITDTTHRLVWFR